LGGDIKEFLYTDPAIVKLSELKSLGTAGVEIASKL